MWIIGKARKNAAKAFWNFVWTITDRRIVAEMTIYRRETVHLHWIPLRTAVAASDSPVPLGAGTSKKADVPSHAYRIPLGMNAIELRFLADADGRVADAYVHMTRKSDDVVLVCKIACTTGAQVATDGRYYVDTMTITEYWIKDLETADISAGNRIARVAFDILGYDEIFVLFDITTGVWGVEIVGF